MAGSPWTNQAVSLIILTEATTGFSGMFGYSPTVGAGNLIFSIAASAGTDPYGNSYPQGVSSKIGQIISNAITTDSLTVNQGPTLFYGNTTQNTVTFNAGSSGNWTAPAGVTSVTATLIGGGGNGSINGSTGGNGGGGGECAVQTFTVVPAQNYAYSVGNAVQNTTFNGITAHAGSSATTFFPGNGGTGSSATTAFAGGAGGTGQDFFIFNQGGGGSSAGPTQPGNSGTAGEGGAAVPGGGAGGTAGSPGSVPGGGGSGNNSGGAPAGAGGQLQLTYSTGGSSTDLLVAIAATAGTDAYSNSWQSGLTVDGNADVTGTLTAGTLNIGTLNAGAANIGTTVTVDNAGDITASGNLSANSFTGAVSTSNLTLDGSSISPVSPPATGSSTFGGGAGAGTFSFNSTAINDLEILQGVSNNIITALQEAGIFT